MFKNVAIIANPKSPNIKDAINVLMCILKKYDVNIIIDEGGGGLLETTVESSDNIFKKADLFVVLGGDGTMLRAAALAYDREIPIVGFHMGRIGFITPFYQQEISSVICDVFSGNLPIQNRMRLTCEIIRDNEIIYTSSALNEIILSKSNLTKMTYFGVYSDGSLIKNYRSDGFIVSTPTGSTGYCLAAGGCITEPSLSLIILIPICPHAMDSKEVVLNPDNVIELRLTEEHQDTLILKDGIIVSQFQYGDVLRVYRSDKVTKMYYNPKRNFIDHLKEKFGWC